MYVWNCVSTGTIYLINCWIARWATLSCSFNCFLTPAHLSVFSGFVHKIARQNWNITSCSVFCLVKWRNSLHGKMGSFKLPTNLIWQINLMTFLCVKPSERMPSWSLSACLSILFAHLMLQADIWWDFLYLWGIKIKGF